MINDPRKPLPFYATYVLFERAMDHWKKNGAPKRFTSVLIRPAVGIEAGRIVSGFEGLGWITDEIGTPSADLLALIDAYGTDAWKSVLRDVLKRAYSFVPGDWSTITPDELSAAFRKHAGRKVGVLTSAETFFLTAATEAGMELSELFAHRLRRSRPRNNDSHAELFSADTAPQPRKSGNGAEPKAGDQNSVTELLSQFDLTIMNQKEKDALLTLLDFKARNPHDPRRQ